MSEKSLKVLQKNTCKKENKCNHLTPFFNVRTSRKKEFH